VSRMRNQTSAVAFRDKTSSGNNGPHPIFSERTCANFSIFGNHFNMLARFKPSRENNSQINRLGRRAKHRQIFARPARQQGRNAIATIRGLGCDGRGRVARRAARRVRSSRVVLSRQCRGQACEMTCRRRWQKSWFTGEITEQP
jgi:hypothetical protein